MDTSRLATLVTAADLGSLSDAARRLGARLSTVSRQVSELEAEVGEPLLLRTGRGVRPTPAGERFVERARQLLRELDAAIAEARGDRAARATTHLRIATPVEVALSLLPPCVAALRRAHPEVTVDVVSASRRVAVVEEEYDAALRLGALAPSGLVARPLGAVRMVACASPPLAARLARTRRRPALALVAVAGAHQPLPGDVRLRVSTFSEAAAIVAASDDLAVVLPSYVATPHVAEGRLARLGWRVALPTVDVSLLLAQRHRHTAALRTFGQLVRARLGNREADRRVDAATGESGA